MQRKTYRTLLAGLLIIAAAFSVWSWFRPYEANEDPAARVRVVGVQVKQDQAFYWLNAHLKVRPGKLHDLAKPVHLVTAAGREVEPADTRLEGSADQPVSELWIKFWLEEADLQGPLKLRINDGTLTLRRGSERPPLGRSGSEYFTSSDW